MTVQPCGNTERVQSTPSSPDIAMLKNDSNSKIEPLPLRKFYAHESHLMKKFSIPEFSALKIKHSIPETNLGKRILSQEISAKKTSSPIEIYPVRKLTPEFLSPKKTRSPGSPAEKKFISEPIAEIPCYSGGGKISRHPPNSGDKSRSQQTKTTSKGSANSSCDRMQTCVEFVASGGSSNQPLLSAPPDVDKKRQFSFTPDDQMTITEESRKHDGKRSGSSSSHSISSAVESPGHSTNQQSQLPSFTHHERPSFSSQTGSISPKPNFSSNESLLHDLTGSPPTDGILDPSTGKSDPTRRKPPNKFLKRAQSFSQFLKKTHHHEKRKKSGEGSRDDYYLPVSHEQLEEAQGEMMLVPVEKLVLLADLNADID